MDSQTQIGPGSDLFHRYSRASTRRPGFVTGFGWNKFQVKVILSSDDGQEPVSLPMGFSMNGSVHARFTREILPHLDAAYSLVRWMVRNDHDAEDIIQEALVKAMRFIDGYEGINARGWLLAIVRNTTYEWVKRYGLEELSSMDQDSEVQRVAHQATPDAALMKEEQGELVRSVVQRLPLHLREVLMLREVEDLSYKSISTVIDAPIGTVMSRLARARELLSSHLAVALKDL